MCKNRCTKIDDYIASFPEELQEKLENLRELIHDIVPTVEEDFQYNMPAFRCNGPLVYFAAYTKHIGFYATPSGHKQFKKELLAYKQGKGSVQLPLNDPLPLDLIKKIIIFKVADNTTNIKQ